ncbi:SDR family NAD(P)-dependent oxidoreductase [Candidatus Avelusimicrobium aviculae]|uniref:SDR family NAD(P)-dependent oxidoreductase n=1 Tax=Candidatus Avelusimicrobium aviculae TaxID=3416206 RepID=UPI003D0FF9C1
MKTALITGASRGIGKAIKALLEEERGFSVYAPSRQDMDLTQETSINAYLATIPHGVDVLVNCAGVNDLAGLEEITDEKINKMLSVNLLAQLHLIKWAAPFMKEKKYGRIVNFSSIWGEFSKTRRLLYSMAKAGINGLTRAAAVELAPYNILVNAVAPGFVNTEMTCVNNTPEQIKQIVQQLPVKRLAQPDEIAQLVGFLASEQNSFMTGQVLYVDGGFSCV